jgi:hypothetical protein
VADISDRDRNIAAAGLRRVTRTKQGRADLIANAESAGQVLNMLIDPDTFMNVASVATNLAYGLTMKEYEIDLTGIANVLIWNCLSGHDDRSNAGLSTLLNLALAGEVYRSEMFNSAHLIPALNHCLRANWSAEVQCRAASLVGCLCRASSKSDGEPDAAANQSLSGAALKPLQCAAMLCNSGILEGVVLLVTPESPRDLWVTAIIAVLDITRDAPMRLALCCRLGMLNKIKTLLGRKTTTQERKLLKVLGRALREYDPEYQSMVAQVNMLQCSPSRLAREASEAASRGAGEADEFQKSRFLGDVVSASGSGSNPEVKVATLIDGGLTHINSDSDVAAGAVTPPSEFAAAALTKGGAPQRAKDILLREQLIALEREEALFNTPPATPERPTQPVLAQTPTRTNVKPSWQQLNDKEKAVAAFEASKLGTFASPNTRAKRSLKSRFFGSSAKAAVPPSETIRIETQSAPEPTTSKRNEIDDTLRESEGARKQTTGHPQPQPEMVGATPASGPLATNNPTFDHMLTNPLATTPAASAAQKHFLSKILAIAAEPVSSPKSPPSPQSPFEFEGDNTKQYMTVL